MLPCGADAQMQQCLQDMLQRANTTAEKISALESMTIDAISLEVGLATDLEISC